jgi:Holliday junction resolvase RusA-like endonuclease
MTLQFTLLVEPKSVQHGARAGLRRGKIHFYSDSDKVAYQTRILLESKHHAPREPLQGPLGVQYIFHLPRPKSNKDEHPYKVPSDLTNLTKGTEDALTKAGFWRDDRQVCAKQEIKRFTADGLPPRIDIVIQSL